MSTEMPTPIPLLGAAKTAATGAIGVIASFGGIFASFLTEIESGLRIISLLVGIAVGLLTFARIWKGDSKRRIDHDVGNE